MKSHLYNTLSQNYPEYEACLKQYVAKKYWDPRICFLDEMIKRVEYLDKVPNDILFDLIFSLKTKYFDKDQPVLSLFKPITSIYFIEEGTVEVWTSFEGNEFRMDTLGPGTVINYRSVFLRDHMFVEMRAVTEVKVLYLKLDTLLALSQKHG